jgi:hypothetical protein
LSKIYAGKPVFTNFAVKLQKTPKLITMKKVLASLAIVALLAGSVSVAGCGKYEEGPSISLRTKKARVVGE